MEIRHQLKSIHAIKNRIYQINTIKLIFVQNSLGLTQSLKPFHSWNTHNIVSDHFNVSKIDFDLVLRSHLDIIQP